MAEEENGIDELMRLSRQFTRQQEEHDAIEKQREAQGKKVRGVLQGLKSLNISMAVSQLKDVASDDVVQKVDSLASKESSEDLRKLISSLADEVERQLSTVTSKNKDMLPLLNTMRTLNILMDLYYSLN